MDKCSPVEMRKNLAAVETYRQAGMDFVVMPVKNQDHKNELIVQSTEILSEMVEALKEAE